MGFVSNLREYEIDLCAPPRERWSAVQASEIQLAERLMTESLAQLAPLLERGLDLRRHLFADLENTHEDAHSCEIASWAEALGRTVDELTLFNCMYELSHVHDFVSSLWKKAMLGCTSGARWVKGLGMVHVRNLDWPLPSMGEGTCIFRFREKRRQFVTVGIPGFVGVLSGMVPKRYSVTLNWAPHQGRPGLDVGPALLLRRVFEECDTYDEAVRMLSSTRLASPVFYNVCGVKKGEACVIERQVEGGAIRRAYDPVIVQANHHLAPGYLKKNNILRIPHRGSTVMDDSVQRATTLKQALMKIESSGSLDEVAFSCLDLEPVCNENTFQQMAFCPKTAYFCVWRWV